MEAPWYLYLITVIIAAPVYVLWAIGAYGLLRVLLSWVFVVESPKPSPGRINAKNHGGKNFDA